MSARATMATVDACDLYDGCQGICLACGEPVDSGVEPDAEGYECEACGEPSVCGLEQALLIGRIDIASA